MRFAKYINQILNYVLQRGMIAPVIFFFIGIFASSFVYEKELRVGDNINVFEIKNSIMTCFTPPKGCAKLIEQTILKAEQDLYIQAYGFTHPKIINAILNVYSRGVNVVIILDKSNVTAKYSGLKRCLDAKIPIFIDTVSSISHNKIVIVDPKNKDKATLITGSFNFSKNADLRNAENLLVIRQKDLVDIYKDNFDTRLNKSLYYTSYLKKYQARKARKK